MILNTGTWDSRMLATSISLLLLSTSLTPSPTTWVRTLSSSTLVIQLVPPVLSMPGLAAPLGKPTLILIWPQPLYCLLLSNSLTLVMVTITTCTGPITCKPARLVTLTSPTLTWTTMSSLLQVSSTTLLTKLGLTTLLIPLMLLAVNNGKDWLISGLPNSSTLVTRSTITTTLTSRTTLTQKLPLNNFFTTLRTTEKDSPNCSTSGQLQPTRPSMVKNGLAISLSISL